MGSETQSESTDFAYRVVDVPLADEMADSFLPYAMTVISGRALPDVRDGLKPVQRLILYGMARMGHCTPNDSHVKSARITGEVMGKYHPHGDTAIYEAMVRMGQSFTLSEPLIHPQGNFGSTDDGPAAPRYTESRMTRAAVDMLESLDEGTVDMVPNYDGTLLCPLVLPTKFPNLLINGSSGIAVGFTCSFLPHNKNEAIEAALLVLDGETDTKALMQVMPAPDFPTGGVLLDNGALQEMYETGAGSVTVRGVAEVEQITARKKGIVVTELPYQVGPEQLITKVKTLMTSGKLPGISSIENYSDRRKGQRVVIECKASADPEAELRKLYAKTPLQARFTMSQVGLLDGVPTQYNLVQLLQAWIDHRLEVLRRQSIFRKAKAETRLHLVEGYVLALADIDEVVKVIRSSSTRTDSRAKLMEKFKLSEVQANAILDLPLGRLTSMEVEKFEEERDELVAEVGRLEKLIKSEARRRTLLKKECNELLATSTPRRTAISDAPANLGSTTAEPVSLPDEDTMYVLSPGGMLECNPDKPGLHKAHVVAPLAVAVDTGGKAHHIRRFDEPMKAEDAARTASDIAALVPINPTGHIVMVSREGKVKRVDPQVWLSCDDGTQVFKLQSGDSVAAVMELQPDEDFVMVSGDARVLRTNSGKIPVKGLAAGGVAGMKQLDDQMVIAAVPAKALLSVIAENNAVSLMSMDEIASKGRGGKGMKLVNLRDEEQAIANVWSHEQGELFVLKGRSKTPQAFPAEVRARGRAMTKNTDAFKAIGYQS